MTTTESSIDGVVARSRLTPSSADELAAALAQADASGLKVAAVGGGTQLDFGMPPTQLHQIIETSRLNGVVEYEPADLTVTVQAGMRFSDLQALLGEQGQFLALDPPALEGATIGGLIATNASGPLRYAYGTARDLVIGTRVANPDGSVTRAGGRVVKNVAGYDLNKLYIGSLGTLGIIVELSFKLAPVPPSFGTVVGEFGTPLAAADLLADVVHSPLSPLAIELLGGAMPVANAVVFRVGGYPEAVERQVRDLRARIAERGGRSPDGTDSVWDDLASARRAGVQRDVVLKATAPLSASAQLVEILERDLSHLRPSVWANAGNGVAYACCEAPSDPEAMRAARNEIARLGENASLVVQRCPTVLKRAFDVWGDPGPSVGLMRALKNKLDPHGTLNPGRYVGGL